MLTAATEAKEIVSAKLAERERVYYCPGCHKRVILKRGAQTTAHFAHQPNANCSVLSEGESQPHLMGKWQLTRYFKPNHVTLEPYLSDIAQRPDLILTNKFGTIAIEYQCAPISMECLLARNEGYQRLSIPVYWILGDRYRKLNKVKQAAKWLRYKVGLGWYLLFWRTDLDQLMQWQQISVSQTGQLSYVKMIGKQSCRPGQANINIVKIRRQIQIGLVHKVPKYMRLQAFCYDHGWLLQDIPEWALLCRKMPPVFTDTPYIWCFLLTVLVTSNPIDTIFNMSELLQFVERIEAIIGQCTLIQVDAQIVMQAKVQFLDSVMTLLVKKGIVNVFNDQEWQLVASHSKL